MADPNFNTLLKINDDYRVRMAQAGDRDQILAIARSHTVTRGMSDGLADTIRDQILDERMRLTVAERTSDGLMLGFMLIVWTPPSPVIDLMLHRRIPVLESGVDADGDPVLTPKGARVYGWLIRAGHIYGWRNGVGHASFVCPAKLWTRLQQLYTTPLFRIRTSVDMAAGGVQDLGNGQVRVHVEFRE